MAHFIQQDLLECGPKCRSKKHAYQVSCAITKGTLEEVQEYSKLCQNLGHQYDTEGRSALHMAATCGKNDIVEWLIAEKNGDLTAKDLESGWTALHRAVFYGQLSTARLLLQYNSDVSTRDHEGLGPLDIVSKDRPSYVKFSVTDPNETYSWGDNVNITLGHTSEQKRTFPESIEIFKKNFISLKKVVLCKYHTVFLSQSGKVYTCGHGHGGRLGHGGEETCVVPKEVNIGIETCIDVAAARDHTLLLMESGSIYSFGLNASHQLGQASIPEKSLLPAMVNVKSAKAHKFLKVCAGRFHSVLFAKDGIFTFGLNAGQLGHARLLGEKISQPRRVEFNYNTKEFAMVQVECSDAATVCLRENGDIFVLHEYKFMKIASKWREITKILICGGHLNHIADLDVLREQGGSDMTVALLNESGKVFLWREKSPTLKKCVWSNKRQMVVTDVCLSKTNIGIVTEGGEAFVGTVVTKKPPSKEQSSKESSASPVILDDFGQMRLLDILLKEEVEDVIIHRTPLVHRGLKMFCDTKGRNFCVLQAQPNVCLTDVPVISASQYKEDFQKLLIEADEYDMVHDVIIKAGGRIWPCHRYILISKSDSFNKLVADARKVSNVEGKVVIHINDVHPDILHQLITYIYTDDCDLLTPGFHFKLSPWSQEDNRNVPDLQNDVFVDYAGDRKVSAYEMKLKNKGKANKENKGMKDQNNPVKMLQSAARKFGIKKLAKRTETVSFSNGVVNHSKTHSTVVKTRYDQHKLKELYDVKIKSDDGVITECHKCVLVARLEYFHSMLATGWVESADTMSVSLPVSHDLLEVLIDYLYTDDSTLVRESHDVELLCDILVVADQMLVVRLKEMCEVSLASLLSLRNVCELLEFSYVYNATQLKSTCLEYILINMAAILELRYLDVLSDEVLHELQLYYRERIPRMAFRTVTPYIDGPSIEVLASLVQNKDDTAAKPDISMVRKTKGKRRRNRNRSTSEDVGDAARERRISCSSDVSIKSDEEEEERSSAMAGSSPVCQTIKEINVNDQQTEENGYHRNQKPMSPKTFPTKTKKIAWSPLNIQDPVAKHDKPSQDTRTVSSSSRTWQASGPKKTLQDGGPQGEDESRLTLRDIMAEQQQTLGKSSSEKLNKKFSWKEAKKHNQQQHSKTIPDMDDSISQEEVHSSLMAKPACPWGNKPSGSTVTVKSFKDLMVEEKSRTTPSSPKPIQPLQGARPKQATYSWGLQNVARDKLEMDKKGKESASETVKSPVEGDNPWKKPTQSSQPSSAVFTEIIKDELVKTENLEKVLKKPLHLIQIEEQAIQELLKHYRSGEEFNQQISVERVSVAMATPVWKSKPK